MRIFSPSFINVNAQVFSPSTPALYGTNNNFPNLSTKASMSYVTGSHNLKVGMNTRHLEENHPRSLINNALGYDFSSPNVPLQINQFGTPRNSFQEANILGLFAQDQWTIDRLTLNLGVRYDHLNGFVPPQTHPESRFVPSFSIDRIDDVPDYHDVNVRLGGAYDLFGDGRTAVKANVGRYVNAIGTNLAQVNNPMEAIILSSSRLWKDANGDLEPNCNLDNFGANGECGAIINPEFGKPIPTTTANEEVLTGWNSPARQLADLRGGSAGSDRASVGRGGVVPPVKHQLPGNRQPEYRTGALLRVQHHGAGRREPGGRERNDAERPVHDHA